jgi:hypothetical protein
VFWFNVLPATTASDDGSVPMRLPFDFALDADAQSYRKATGEATTRRSHRWAIDTSSVHAGLPVLNGEKWLATKWLRQDTHKLFF